MTADNQSQNVFQRIAVAARGGIYGRNASYALLGASVTSQDDEFSMEVGSQSRLATLPVKIQNPHNQVISNAQPFIDGI